MPKLIGPSKYHRTLNGVELVKARESLDMNQTEFAALCGWSQPYQSQIEAPEEHEVHKDITDRIAEVIERTKE